MAESQLAPHELDRVEDSLENLERHGVPSDSSTAVQQLLADYQQILVASREALPIVEVPLGLLDSVMAEARSSAADGAEVLGLGEAPTEAPAKPSFWSRFGRGFWIPGLAVAGTAAMVLLLVKPTMEDAPVMAEKHDAAAPTSVIQQAPSAAPEPDAAFEDADAAPAAKAEADPPAPAATAAPAAEGDGKLVEIATSKLGRLGGPGAVAGGVMPSADPASADDEEAEESKQDTSKVAGASEAGWDAVEQGDRARKNGDCFAARNHYSRALDDGNDSVRARAHAGIGLCESDEGDDASAGEHFEQAELLDPEVRSYIGTQTPDRPKSRPKAKRRTPKKRKVAPAPPNDNRNESFDKPFK